MEWVRCSERLPERGVNVLVLDHSGGTSVRYIPHSQGDDKTIYAGDDGKSWYPGGWGVGWTTHWMYLPETPND